MMINENEMFAEERQSKIVELINKRGKVSVNDLVDYFKVSPSTIRNDLNELESKGLLKRTHGGAIKETKLAKEFLPSLSSTKMVEEKISIAKLANTLINDGDIIALSSGTTIFELVKTLTNKKNLTIILNNLQMASWLEENTNFTVVVLGGILRNNYHFLVNPTESELLKLMNIDKAFISVNGVSIEKGITTADLDTAMNYRNMIHSSLKTYVLSDSSKLDTVSFAKVMDISNVTSLITDDKVSKEIKEQFEKYTDVLIG